MPIYEYECDGCHHTFEVWQKITEGPVTKCESCGGPNVHKLISHSSFHLKGTGWYLTDYARKGSSSDSKAPKKSSESTTPEKSSTASQPSSSASSGSSTGTST